MLNLWKNQNIKNIKDQPLSMRVYSSRLLGQNPDLVLHGGGNTSVKIMEQNIFGEEEEILYVKGSGFDLQSIDIQGFTPMRLDYLKKVMRLNQLSDAEMINQLKQAITDPQAPSPSVETLLHAIIPLPWVDHTHADAIVTLTNTNFGEGLIRNIFGDRILVCPYVMPGFKLARQVYQSTLQIDWKKYEGIVLLNHGLFTFGESAQESYERMIQLVTEAEKYLKKNTAAPKKSASKFSINNENLLSLAQIRKQVSLQYGSAVLANWNYEKEALSFSNKEDAKKISQLGPMVSDHLIRTKAFPMFVDEDPFEKTVSEFASKYKSYFDQYSEPHHEILDQAPRWALWNNKGMISFGKNWVEIQTISDICKHTLKSIEQAELLGGWVPISRDHQFEAEYWELQQAKIKSDTFSELEGKVAIVSGAASGIGLACALELNRQGAAVVGLDLNEKMEQILSQSGMLGITCDVTNEKAMSDAIFETVRRFGGIDILVLNAGTFPAGQTIEDMDEKTWEKSLAINLTAPQKLLQKCTPFLKEGLDPAVVFMASRNVPAPGPGAAAYSVPKAGQTQMARIAALELGKFGIRVNTLHPDCVYDTGLWTAETLERSAKRYGLTVEEYKSRNVLKKDVTSDEVAKLVCALAGPLFAKTTGAQIPIDGGNDRVI